MPVPTIQMRFDLEIDGQEFSVERRSSGDAQFFSVDGRRIAADICRLDAETYSVLLGSHSYDIRILESDGDFEIEFNGTTHRGRVLSGSRPASGVQIEEDIGFVEVRAPMPGKIVRVLVTEGAKAEAQQPLLVIEAMKMQNELRAPRKGKVISVSVSEGQAVAANALLLTLE